MFKQKPLAAAVSMAVWSLATLPVLAQAQAQDQESAAAVPIQTVEVTGIRASLARSLAVKRDASANVEVITAEDVGKMPDKNVADSLQRLPGVTISSAGATEGGFDENDRVSMRGTNPSLTQTLINWNVSAPASGLSVGLFYGVGLVFAVSAGLILLADLYRAVTGKLSEAELVMVKESEEQEQFEALQRELRERDLREAGAAGAATLGPRA